MNKKIFGIKIGTILQAFVCLIVAFIIWFIVKYTNMQETETALNYLLAVFAPVLRL